MPIVTSPYPGAPRPFISRTYDEHVQQVTSRCLLGGVCYGPALTSYDSVRDQYILSHNWKAGIREPLGGWREDLNPAAACSTLVGFYLGVLLDAGTSYRSGWGRGIKKALGEDKFLQRYVDDRYGWQRKYDFGHLPQMPQVVNVALYYGHVVIILDASKATLHHPETGVRLTGQWVLAQDGYYKDTKDGNGKVILRRYSETPLKLEAADTRWERQKGNPDKSRLISVIGIRQPDAWKPTPRLAIA